MNRTNITKIIGWLFVIIIFFICIESIGYIGMKMYSRNNDFLSNRNYFEIRDMLRSNNKTQKISKYISVPYLNYIPNPYYESNGQVQHNSSGYRGKKSTLKKNKHYRIVCMGGSTTYGTGVKNPIETYPAQLEKILNEWEQADELNLPGNGIEIINAGLEAGNSGEELMQYEFKYRYYDADLIILHSGGNDAMVLQDEINFQLDYSHFRRPRFHLEPLPDRSRWMLKSYFVSFAVIHLLYSDFSDYKDYFSDNDKHQYAQWYNSYQIDDWQTSNKYYPFYQNHSNLISMIKRDGAKVIDMTFALNPNDKMVQSFKEYVSNVERNNKIIEQLTAEDSSFYYLKYSYDSIPKSNYWIDDCHLNMDGEYMKAMMVARFIKNVYSKN